MSAVDRRPPPSPEQPSLQPGVKPVTPAWSEPSASPAEDIREFIQQLLSETPPGAGYTPPEPWQEQLAQQVLESDCTDWRLVHTRKGAVWSCARGDGKTTALAQAASSPKDSEELLTRFKSAATTFVTPEHLSVLELRQRVLQRYLEQGAVSWLDEPCTDPRWDDASPRLPRRLLELSLASEACRSLMR